MSRGLGKIQQAILGYLRLMRNPNEVGWLARAIYNEVNGSVAPDPIPHTFLVSVRRAVRSLEQSGHVTTGLATRYLAPRNHAHDRLKLNLTKWVWLPDTEPPMWWCSPLSPDHAVHHVSVSSPPSVPFPVAAGSVKKDGEETLTVADRISVSSPVSIPFMEGRRGGWFEKTPQELDAYFNEIIDGYYKIKADELAGLDAMAAAQSLGDFLDLKKDDPKRIHIFRLIMRRNA